MLATLNHHLVTTLGACGDVVRNIMCCPAPLGDRQRADVGAYAQEAARRFRPRTQANYELRLDGERAVTAKAPGEEPLYGTTYLPRKVQDRLRVSSTPSLTSSTDDLDKHSTGSHHQRRSTRPLR